jgi:hypothetical protein
MSNIQLFPISYSRLTPVSGHFFFGYYDLVAVDTVGRHLCHKVTFRDRLPVPGDIAVLGWVPLPQNDENLEDQIFHPFSETKAWNFQQGAMLQWLPARPGTCIYNIFNDGNYGSCLYHLETGNSKELPLPVASVSLDGTKALCINMSRVYDFRPGYGYEELPDPYSNVPAPDEDGVFLMDLDTGDNSLLLSLAEAVEFLASCGEKLDRRKVVINHITFNLDASRFLFLLRTFPRDSSDGWTTFLLTADLNGCNLRMHQVWGAASHYHWRDGENILVYIRTGPEDQSELVLLNDLSGEMQIVDQAFFTSDGHCSYSPDLRWIMYDSYPDTSNPAFLRNLLIYDLDQRSGYLLGRLRSEGDTPQTVDLRCDLHPRWLQRGKSISFDSIHEGFRGMYWADLSNLVDRFQT